MQRTSYAKVNNGTLHIVTPSVMYSIPLHTIQTITVAAGLVHIHYINPFNGGGRAVVQLHETYYPIITDAICNAPNITSNVNNNITGSLHANITATTLTRSF